MTSASSKKNKTNNPLYVVTNDGKDVTSADNLWDAVVTKFNLKPLIDLLLVIFEALAKQINSYAALVWLNEELTKLNERIDALLKKTAPWLYFYQA